MVGSKLWESVLVRTAGVAWSAFQAGNRLFSPHEPVFGWAPVNSRRAAGQAHPPLFGVPRNTMSLCPECVRTLRQSISAGQTSIEDLRTTHPGRIPARILERDGRVVMEKDCPAHGHFEETLSTNPAFTRRIERLFPGRDFDSSGDPLHDHGPSSIRYGRGGVLTIDLTNRCDMMCDPCFMDANQVGYVHELTFDEVKQLIDNALTIRPRRQISIQFSGGEPTLSPIFLDAVAYARKVGYFSVQAATNGIRFAQDAEFARAGGRGGPAHRLPAVRRRRRGGERAPQGAEPVRGEAARDREPLRGRHRRRARRHRRADGQRPPGRPHRQVRGRERRQDQLRRVPAGVVHRPRRGHRRRAARCASATRCRSWSRTSSGRPACSSRCATGSRCPRSARPRTSPI